MLDKNQWLAVGLLSGFAYILGKDRESFEAESQEKKTRYKITMDSWPMRIHVDGCPIAKNIPKEHHWEGTFTPQEVAQTAYDTLFYNESLPEFEGNTFGELRKTYAKDLIIPCNCTIHGMKSIKELDPATFTRQPNETQEHWDAESFEAHEYSYYHRNKALKAWRKNYEASGILDDSAKWNELYDSFDKYKSQGFSQGQSMVKSMREMGIYNQLMQGVNVDAFLDHYSAESFEAKEMRREWTFLWKPKNEGWGNSVYATNLNGAKEQILKTYPKGSSFFQRADLSTLTDDPFVNKQRWRNWDSQWNAESFEAKYNLIGRRKPRKLSLKVSDLKEALENANDDADVFVGDITPVGEEMIGEPIVSAPRGVWTNGEEVYIVGATDWIHTEQIDELTWNRVNRAKGAESFEAENRFNAQMENIYLVALGRAHQEILNGGERATMEIWFEGRPVMFAIDNAAGYFAINPRVLQSRYDSHNFVEPEWRDEYHQALSALKEAFPSWSMFSPKLEKSFDL